MADLVFYGTITAPSTFSIAIGETKSLGIVCRDACGTIVSNPPFLFSRSVEGMLQFYSDGSIKGLVGGTLNIRPYWVKDCNEVDGNVITVTVTATPPPPSANYYVATNGNDANTGDYDHPLRNIQTALNRATAGQTIDVRGGTYYEHLSFPTNGSAGNFITLEAYGNEIVTVDVNGLVGNWDGGILVSSKSYIQIKNIKVINSSFFGIMVNNYGGTRPSNVLIEGCTTTHIAHSGLYTESADYITYDGNTISDTEYDTNQVGENVDLVDVNHFEVKNNTIYATGNFEAFDAKIGCKNGSIHHNHVIPTDSCGIYIDAWTGLSENIDVYDNYVHRDTYTRSGSRGIAIGAEQGGHATNIRIFNNIVVNMPATGINIPWYSKGTVDYVKIINNTVVNCDNTAGWAGGIGVQTNTNGGTTAHITVRNNIVSQNGVAQISDFAYDACTNNLIDGNGGITGTDYVTGNPQFVNPGAGDYHIQSTSPAKDHGTATDAPATDYDNYTRPYNGIYDIGAYEYHP